MYFLRVLGFLLFFAPAMILVLLGIRGKRVHVNAIYAVSIYTLAWGALILIMTLADHTDKSFVPWVMIFACAVVGATLISSTRDIRLAKLSAVIAFATTVLLPFTLN